MIYEKSSVIDTVKSFELSNNSMKFEKNKTNNLILQLNISSFFTGSRPLFKNYIYMISLLNNSCNMILLVEMKI